MSNFNSSDYFSLDGSIQFTLLILNKEIYFNYFLLIEIKQNPGFKLELKDLQKKLSFWAQLWRVKQYTVKI